METTNLLQLIVLFLVIIDPLASFTVFLVATSSMTPAKRRKIALLAMTVAIALSAAVLILGDNLLKLFSTDIDEFRIAGGIILGILGVKMTLGLPLASVDKAKGNSATAIASIIGTPFITGPATITAIIITSNDYGRMMTGLAAAIVLAFTGIIFLLAHRIKKMIGMTTVQVLSTILGLITVAWGVSFIKVGIQNIFLG